MTLLNPNIKVYNIVNYLDAKPIKKKTRKFNPSQFLLIKYELKNILKYHFIEPIDYLKWVSNMVPISRSNSRIHVCTKFCDLNKVYISRMVFLYPIFIISKLKIP